MTMSNIAAQRITRLERDLAHAREGYNQAIAAGPHMPKEARPYTEKIAEHYATKIRQLEEYLEYYQR